MTTALPRRRAAGEAELRAALLRFLAVNERPDEWTFFQPGRGPVGMRTASPGPDIVIETAGRVAYVEVMRQDGGPLPGPRRLHQRLARRRGAAVFVVRSVPELERAMGSLGIALRPHGRLARDLRCPALKGKDADHGTEP